MRQVYAVLVLTLLALFALSSVASAGVFRYEDYERPDNPLGGLDEDHPWGGDKIVLEGNKDDGDDAESLSLITTNYLAIDLWLVQLYQLIYNEQPPATSQPTYKSRPLTERSYRVITADTPKPRYPRRDDGKAVAR